MTRGEAAGSQAQCSDELSRMLSTDAELGVTSQQNGLSSEDPGPRHEQTHPSALQLQPGGRPGLRPQGIAQHLLIALQEAFGTL